MKPKTIKQVLKMIDSQELPTKQLLFNFLHFSNDYDADENINIIIKDYKAFLLKQLPKQEFKQLELL